MPLPARHGKTKAQDEGWARMTETSLTQALRALDWPPVWTAAAVGLVWVLSLVMPWPILGATGQVLGAVAALTGLGLMLAAVLEMRAARTTFIPRRQPTALVTTGVFEWSRNPIYLGDVLVLAGAMLWFKLVWALPMLGVFGWILRWRFIDGEEQRLLEAFGAEYGLWAARTARWFGRRPGKEAG
ncbi:MAG: isoprenylcysteine carboxylmethyltransferase family protein [Paracoccaceae bacterium]